MKAKLQRVEIEWIDSATNRGWQRPEEITKQPTTSPCLSIGYLTRFTKEDVQVIQSRHDTRKDTTSRDYWADAIKPVFTLRPRTTKEAGGEEAAFDPRGCCVFYADGRCGIHAAKPHECATAKHDVAQPDDWHRRTMSAWDNKKSQALILELLGRDPERSEPSWADVFEIIFAGLSVRK